MTIRDQIILELDIEVKNKLEEYGKECGWELDETLRYILGREAAMIPISSPTVRQRLAPPMSLRGSTEGNLDPQTLNMAILRALVGSGAVKCKKCFKQLSTDDVIRGDCPQCDEKI